MADKYADRIAECVSQNIEYTDYSITLKNFRFWSSEFDVLHLDGSDYLYEYEIKTSIADYKADFKKTVHQNRNKHEEIKKGRVNYFYFVFPYNMIPAEDVPDYCGVIYYTGTGIEIIREAPLLNKEVIPNRVELMHYMAEKLNHLTKKLKNLKMDSNGE